MTTVSSIIKDAFRETNLVGINSSPSTAEYAEGLSQLQTVVSSVMGNEAGESLLPVSLTASLPGNCHLPPNTRLMLNLTSATSLSLPLKPDDGARLGIVDVANNLSTFNLTLSGNGRNIEGASSLVLSTSGLTAEWFYRQDLGNWVRVTDLTLTGDFPFPREFDTLFSTMLAMRLNPRNGQALSPESGEMMRRARSQFRSRYRQSCQTASELALLRLGNLWYSKDYQSHFETGCP